MIASSQASGMKSSYRANATYHQKKPRAHIHKTNLSTIQADTQSSSSTINQSDQQQDTIYNRLLAPNIQVTENMTGNTELADHLQQQQKQQQTSLLRYVRYNLIPSMRNLMKSFKKKEG